MYTNFDVIKKVLYLKTEIPDGSLLRKVLPGLSHPLRGNCPGLRNSVDLANLQFEQIAARIQTESTTKGKSKYVQTFWISAPIMFHTLQGSKNLSLSDFLHQHVSNHTLYYVALNAINISVDEIFFKYSSTR